MNDPLDSQLDLVRVPPAPLGLAAQAAATATARAQKRSWIRRGARAKWLRRPFLVGGAAIGLAFTGAVAATYVSTGRIGLPDVGKAIESLKPDERGREAERMPPEPARVAEAAAVAVDKAEPGETRTAVPDEAEAARRAAWRQRIRETRRIVAIRRAAGLPTPVADRIEAWARARAIVRARRAAGLPTPGADRLEAMIERRRAWRRANAIPEEDQGAAPAHRGEGTPEAESESPPEEGMEPPPGGEEALPLATGTGASYLPD